MCGRAQPLSPVLLMRHLCEDHDMGIVSTFLNVSGDGFKLVDSHANKHKGGSNKRNRSTGKKAKQDDEEDEDEDEEEEENGEEDYEQVQAVHATKKETGPQRRP